MPTISRQLASAGIADPGDLKSPSLPGASPGLPTGVWFTGNSRPVRFKTEQPWECKSPHADQFGMSTGRASRALVLTSASRLCGMWRKSTAFRQSSLKRRNTSESSFCKSRASPEETAWMEFDRQKPLSQFESENDCTSSFERAIMGLEDLRKTRK